MGIDLYPSLIHEGDLSSDAFGSEIDEICNEINEACEGFGTDEDRLLKAMGSQNAETRCKVPIRYKELFDRELKDVMKSECGSRDFGTALQFLAAAPIEAECDMIKRACKGFGTHELMLSTILCGRTNQEMDLLKKKYFDLHSKDLGRKLDSELGGNYEQLIFNALQAAEEEYDQDEIHNDDKMEEDIAKLYEMGQGQWGTDEAGMFKILCASPAEYLQKLNLAYADKHGLSLVKAIETEMGGDCRTAALFLLGMKLKPYEEVAKLIRAACEGFGTDELLLTTTLIRYQSIMKEVQLSYMDLYEETVEDRITSETSRDYRKLLLEVLAAGS